MTTIRAALVVAPLLLLATQEARADGPGTGSMEVRLALPGTLFFSTQVGPGAGVVVGDPPTTFLMGLGGGFGYFINENFEVGGELAIATVAMSGSNVFDFYLGPLARYVVPLGGSLSGWGEAKLGLLYAHASTSNRGYTSSGSTTVFRVGGSGGIDYNVTSSLALFVGAGVDLYMGDSFVVPIGVTYGMRGYL